LVIAGKVFKLMERSSMEQVAEKLSGYKSETPLEGTDISLMTEIKDLKSSPDGLQGLIYRDVPVRLLKRGKMQMSFRTLETPFAFFTKKSDIYLLIVEKKHVANALANKFSELLFLSIGGILNSEIQPETIESYHRNNSDGTKVMFFDGLDIPNIDKLSLYGPSLSQTPLYSTYLSRGRIWYTVLTSNKYGYVVGLTRDSVVVVFNRVSTDDFTGFVGDEILQLIS
jgi:hypothetical protein